MAKRYKTKPRFKVFLIILIVLILGGGGFAFYYFTTPQITLKGETPMEVTMKDGYKEPGAEAPGHDHGRGHGVPGTALLYAEKRDPGQKR